MISYDTFGEFWTRADIQGEAKRAPNRQILGDLGMLTGLSASHEDDKRVYLRLSEAISLASIWDLGVA